MIVLWRITEHCNLACGFCAYDRRLAGPRHAVDRDVVERFGSVLGEYQRSTDDRVLLSWLGGEPLLWPPLLEVSHRLRHIQGITISATTNGSKLHLPRITEGILAAFSELTVSVDGLADFHESVRGHVGGWQRLRSSVQNLGKARDAAGVALKLRANVVLMHENLQQFGDLCRALVEWRIDEITFNQLGGRDRPEFFAAQQLSTDDVRALRAMLPDLRAALAAQGVTLCASEPYLARIAASAVPQALPIGDCLPGERLLFIDERSRIAPCSFTNDDYAVAVADIRDARDLLALPARFRAARSAMPAQACGDCPATHVFSKFAV